MSLSGFLDTQFSVTVTTTVVAGVSVARKIVQDGLVNICSKISVHKMKYINFNSKIHAKYPVNILWREIFKKILRVSYSHYNQFKVIYSLYGHEITWEKIRRSTGEVFWKIWASKHQNYHFYAIFKNLWPEIFKKSAKIRFWMKCIFYCIKWKLRPISSSRNKRELCKSRIPLGRALWRSKRAILTLLQCDKLAAFTEVDDTQI